MSRHGSKREYRVERSTGTGTQVEKRTWVQRAPVVWINDAGANSYITDHSLSGAEQSPNDDRVITEDSVLENGKLKRMSYGYDQYNNVTSINEYDFGTDPNLGVLKQHTDRTYANNVLMNGYCYSNLSAKAGSCSSAVSTDFNAHAPAPPD
jgi:hypothetical protein